MNIRRGLEKALYWILNMSQIPPQLSTKGSVQPVIDYHKIMKTPETITIPSTAGNVEYTISPGNKSKFHPEYGRLKLTNDATVADRFIQIAVEDTAGLVLLRKPRQQGAITASQTKYFNIDQGGHHDEGTSIHDNGGVSFRENIYETDVLSISITGGVAGDAYDGYLKLVSENVKRET